VDKFRALQYFAASANAGSFSRAAQEIGVSVPAVSRLITQLEKSLGVRLFERSVQGLTLTADGESYLDTCGPLMEQLAMAEATLSATTVRPSGTLVVGAPTMLSQHCILPHLPAFHARHPNIDIDIRMVDKPSSPDADVAEVLVLFGWPEHRGLIHRRLANSRMLICASPKYWAIHGVPSRIMDLEHHTCLLFRDHEGTVIDLWEHERDGVRESATVNGWLVSSHRDDLVDAAIAGLGVGRFGDFTVQGALKSGELAPVLVDWESRHAPPIGLFYRSSQRRLPRVRLFVGFLTDVFQQMEAHRGPQLAVQIPPERPPWYRRRHARASATPRPGN